MTITRFVAGPLQTNCYLVTCEATGETVVVDPGDVTRDLLEAIRNRNVTAIALTHGHFDHIGGVDEVIDATGAPLFIHERDIPLLTDPHRNGSAFFGGNVIVTHTPQPLPSAGGLRFGDCSLEIIPTPGHSLGGVTFYEPGILALTGDTLFRMSVGRWDLMDGDYDALMTSLRSAFPPMPGNTRIYPGHGDESDIAFERTHNQFLHAL